MQLEFESSALCDGKILVYMDHNILNQMLKCDTYKIVELLSSEHVQPVFSIENIKEIHRSKGYENDFLTLLKNLNAKFLQPVMENSKPTTQACISDADPVQIFNDFQENVEITYAEEFGMKILQNIFGGDTGQTNAELHKNFLDELIQSVESIIPVVDDMQNASVEQKDLIYALPSTLRVMNPENPFRKVENTEFTIKSFREYLKIEPAIINNIQGGNVVLKLWEHIKCKNSFSGEDLLFDLDVFIGLKKQNEESEVETTLMEKVNIVYNWLNLIGYHQDTDMKIRDRLNASFSDMTHSGLASFCHLFLCADERMIKKTCAAYDYLGVQTKIIHYKPVKTLT